MTEVGDPYDAMARAIAAEVGRHYATLSHALLVARLREGYPDPEVLDLCGEALLSNARLNVERTIDAARRRQHPFLGLVYPTKAKTELGK